jgi:WD40 repeat protein
VLWQGHRLAIQQDDLVSLWDMKQCIQLTVVPGSGPVVFSPDSRLLACSDPLRPVVVLWNVEAGTRLFELRCHDDEVLAVSAVARAEQDEEGPALQIEKIEFDVDSAHLLSTWAPDDSAVLWNIAPGAAFHKVRLLTGSTKIHQGHQPATRGHGLIELMCIGAVVIVDDGRPSSCP